MAPVIIPEHLPATEELKKENIFVMNELRAIHQDIRPLKLVILNLMPLKITTETQLLRLIGNSLIQVDIVFLHMASHTSKNTAKSHLEAFYHTFGDIRSKHFDGMIITGAPIEHLDFEEVSYWDELSEILEWAKTHVFSTFHICWGAQAGLYYHYGIPKYPLEEKMFGVFPHTVEYQHEPLFRGFDDVFHVPHSRHTEIREEDIRQHRELDILSTSDVSGVYIVADRARRNFYVTGHSEYDRETLAKEYFRDLNKGLPIRMPENYFIGDDPDQGVHINWKGHGHLLFSNWLNYYVYQMTEYDFVEKESGD